MHYQDFNNAGDKKQLFYPLDLIQKNPLLEDDIQSQLSQDDDDFVLDDFTKKRMPRMEDFVTDQQQLMQSEKGQQTKPKTKKEKSLINDFQEKILSLKNKTTHQPTQNHLILDDSALGTPKGGKK